MKSTQNIRPSVLIIENGKLLTMRYEYNGQAVYNIPGGNLEFGEEMEATVVRELEEELLLKVGVKELSFIAEVKVKSKETVHFIYSGSIIGNGEPKLNPKETTAKGISWLPLLEIEKFNLYPNIGSYINQKQPQTQFLGLIDQKWF